MKITNDIDWLDVRYDPYVPILQEGQLVRVKRTGHIGIISNITHPHTWCYHIEPRDPNDFGGHWYFSFHLQIPTIKKTTNEK